jgi:predicted O-linked N-acetylglucosamine transferase (SPINDLY family)
MSIFELMALTHRYLEDQQPQAAIDLYATWLRENPTAPHWSLACFNLGVILAGSGDFAAAMQTYRQAFLAGSIEAGINLALLTEQRVDQQTALGIWQVLRNMPLAEEPTRCLILNNLGRILEELGSTAEAERVFADSLQLQPDQPAVRHHRFYLRQHHCQWPLTDDTDHLERLVAMNPRQIRRFLALVDDPDQQVRVIEQWLRLSHRPDVRLLHQDQEYMHDRLRIGYLLDSPDSDSVAWVQTVVPRHEAVEAWLFVRQQTIDPAISLHGLSDLEAAQVIRHHEIDILVDLDGYHQALLDYRPASLQLEYLATPVWVNQAGVDYVLVDAELAVNAPVPLKMRTVSFPARYGLATTVMANDATVSSRRAAYGLPDTGIVFCHAGAAYRITETLFSVWMEILKQVPDSVLWLAVDPEIAHESLRATALHHGVASERLILVTEWTGTALALADMMLDTYPASSATTGYAALRHGVPVLTWAGQSPASRITASYLTALRLPELITSSPEEYQATAVGIASNRHHLNTLKTYLSARLPLSGLSDLTAGVHSLEARYVQLQAEANGRATPPRPIRYQPDPKPFFSIIVVHYEGSVSRQDAIRCLQSLYHQKYDNFEILLLHDGPRVHPWETDEFPPPSTLRLKVYSTPQRANDYGHSLRDLGLSMARGQYVLITNADNYHYTDMLLKVYQEITRPYPPVLIHDIDRTAPDIIIFGILAKGYLSLGTHENLIDFREFNQEMAARQWLYLSGYPAVVKNIDCMQFVMRRDLWLREGGWYIKVSQAADGLLFQEMVKKYGVRYLVGPLAEHL